MNTKTILGVSFTAVFAVSMIFAQNVTAEETTYLDILDTVTERTRNTVDVTFTTGGTIPTDGANGAFGYGLITGVNNDGLPENVLALTTHICVADSFEQSNVSDEDCPNTVGLLEALGLGVNTEHDGPEFHAHILDLTTVDPEGDSPCASLENGAGLEVDLARTLQTQNNVSPSWSVTVSDDTISVEGVHIGDLHSANLKHAASVPFGIHGFVDGTAVTNLCLTDGS